MIKKIKHYTTSSSKCSERDLAKVRVNTKKMVVKDAQGARVLWVPGVCHQKILWLRIAGYSEEQLTEPENMAPVFLMDAQCSMVLHEIASIRGAREGKTMLKRANHLKLVNHMRDLLLGPRISDC
jgi:hypothetical protein